MTRQFQDRVTARRFDVELQNDGSASVTYTPFFTRQTCKRAWLAVQTDDPRDLVANVIACDEARLTADRFDVDIDEARFAEFESLARARLFEVG